MFHPGESYPHNSPDTLLLFRIPSLSRFRAESWIFVDVHIYYITRKSQSYNAAGEKERKRKTFEYNEITLQTLSAKDRNEEKGEDK